MAEWLKTKPRMSSYNWQPDKTVWALSMWLSFKLFSIAKPTFFVSNEGSNYNTRKCRVENIRRYDNITGDHITNRNSLPYLTIIIEICSTLLSYQIQYIYNEKDLSCVEKIVPKEDIVCFLLASVSFKSYSLSLPVNIRAVPPGYHFAFFKMTLFYHKALNNWSIPYSS